MRIGSTHLTRDRGKRERLRVELDSSFAHELTKHRGNHRRVENEYIWIVFLGAYP